jgi:serine/threonine protein kinase|tara:strand:+ start:2475 stop:3059 length:585 start_codon:yes stop_codon:yes gene_type:complete
MFYRSQTKNAIINLSHRDKDKLKQLGRIKFLDYKTNSFIKIYKTNILKDDSNQILKRISIINSFVNYNLSIPLTVVTIENDEIVVKQDYLKKAGKLNDIPAIKREKLLLDLEATIDTLHSIGFVHGDINRKNIIYAENKLWLIDIEPSLKQIKNGLKKWMVTRPYAAPEDLKNKNITEATDIYAFGCFKKWFVD